MALREWLLHWQFWSLEIGFVILAITTAISVRPLIRSLALPSSMWIAAAGLAVASVMCARMLPPETNRIYYDEHIYQGIGQNLADRRLAQMCLFGNAETGQLECFAGEYNKQPYAYPHLLSVVYRMVGVHEGAAHKLNAVVFGLTVFAVFLLVVQLSGDPYAGLLGGLVLMLTPEALRWSATAAAEPSAALFAVLAVVAATQFSRTGSTASLVWAIAASSYAVQFRPESLLVLPLVGIQLARGGIGRIGGTRLLAGVALGAALTAVHVAHLVTVRTEGWGTSGDPMSAAFVPGNLVVNGGFYLWDHRFPMWYTAFAVVGLLAGSGGWRNRLVLATYFALFFSVFLFFYAGSYNYGADVRYSLTTYPPLAALAGLGLAAIAARIRRGASDGLATAVAGLVVVWGFWWFAPHVRAEGDEAWGARADVAFAREAITTLPANSLIFTHNPGMFQLWGRNAAQLSIATPEPQVMAAWRARYGNRIYLHWNFWCNVADPAQQQFCRDMFAQFSTELVAEHVERNYRFAFYRIE